MKSVKIKKIDKRNECVIDFYKLIDTIDINQIRFTDFYRFTTPGCKTLKKEGHAFRNIGKRNKYFGL